MSESPFPKFRDYKEQPITVAELIKELSTEPPDNPIEFGWGLTFYRVKDRSGATQIEFNETGHENYRDS
jgi:hypothetical protein